jgi:hypothetical protein
MPKASNNRRAQGMSSMMIVWMVVGIGTLLAGLGAIAYGILLDFSLGNSLIVAGTVAACTGLLLLALSVVVTELKIIARQLADPQKATDARVRAALLQAAPSAARAQAAVDDAFPFSQDEAAPGHSRLAAPPAVPQGLSPPWDDESTPEPPPAPVAPAPKPKRNLLFESNLRKDRERAAARVEPMTSDPQLSPPVPPPMTEAGEAPSPATFDDAWPKPERAAERVPDRPVERSRRNARGSNHAASNGSAAPPRPEQPPTVTVIKSGVVDGMAYSLYSDGSIEAQMPEGMMRFASIDELRAHLDHRP